MVVLAVAPTPLGVSASSYLSSQSLAPDSRCNLQASCHLAVVPLSSFSLLSQDPLNHPHVRTGSDCPASPLLYCPRHRLGSLQRAGRSSCHAASLCGTHQRSLQLYWGLVSAAEFCTRERRKPQDGAQDITFTEMLLAIFAAATSLAVTGPVLLLLTLIKSPLVLLGATVSASSQALGAIWKSRAGPFGSLLLLVLFALGFSVGVPCLAIAIALSALVVLARTGRRRAGGRGQGDGDEARARGQVCQVRLWGDLADMSWGGGEGSVPAQSVPLLRLRSLAQPHGSSLCSSS